MYGDSPHLNSHQAIQQKFDEMYDQLNVDLKFKDELSIDTLKNVTNSSRRQSSSPSWSPYLRPANQNQHVSVTITEQKLVLQPTSDISTHIKGYLLAKPRNKIEQSKSPQRFGNESNNKNQTQRNWKQVNIWIQTRKRNLNSPAQVTLPLTNQQNTSPSITSDVKSNRVENKALADLLGLASPRKTKNRENQGQFLPSVHSASRSQNRDCASNLKTRKDANFNNFEMHELPDGISQKQAQYILKQVQPSILRVKDRPRFNLSSFEQQKQRTKESQKNQNQKPLPLFLSQRQASPQVERVNSSEKSNQQYISKDFKTVIQLQQNLDDFEALDMINSVLSLKSQTMKKVAFTQLAPDRFTNPS